MNGVGGGEAVVSLETATLNGDGRGGGDRVLSLAVVTLILCKLSPSWSLSVTAAAISSSLSVTAAAIRLLIIITSPISVSGCFILVI